MTKREDKRSRKTVKAIQNALLDMLAEQSLADIKIVDLCRRADINRTTFYLHYANTDEVQQSIREEIVGGIFERYRGESLLYALEHPLPFLNVCMKAITSYEGLENFVRHSAEAACFLEDLKKAFVTRALDEYYGETPNGTPYAYYLINFMTAGTLNTFTAWLLSDKKQPLPSILDRCAKMLAAGREALTEGRDPLQNA